MPGIDRFVFNGLRGSDLVIFNLLSSTGRNLPLSGNEIARLTCYDPSTVYRSLRRLRAIKILECHRAKRGQRYHYTIKA